MLYPTELWDHTGFIQNPRWGGNLQGFQDRSCPTQHRRPIAAEEWSGALGAGSLNFEGE